MMNLHLLWFSLIAMLFTGFFVLEGFDYGVGILLPFLGKNDSERRMILRSIGPFWDGNEVWLITAGGAIFAAFPIWYATMFSGFYPEMFFILVALILRGAAFEFRSMHESIRWRRTWDWLIFTGSLLPGFLWGIILANMIRGVPINAHLDYVGSILDPLNPFALLCGITLVAVFTLHGAIFLSLRLEGGLIVRAQRTARKLCLPVLILFLLVVGVGYNATVIFRALLLDPKMVPLGYLMMATLVFTPWLLARKYSGWAFAMTTATIVLAALTVGIGLFPHMMISSLNPAWSLTVDNASSSPYTLTILSWIALTCIPFVLAYQAWNYWVFRQRISPHTMGGH